MIACFASGFGSNFQALIDANIPIDMLVTDNPNAYAVTRAREHNIPVLPIMPHSF